MSNINKTYDFIKSEESFYNIDNYTLHNTKAISIDLNGNVKLKNFNDSINTDNFYGDGRLGIYKKMNTDRVRPGCFYFKHYENHNIYGPCLIDAWYDESNSIKAGDEVILYKKHVEKEEYIDEFGEWEIVTIKEKITDGEGKIHYVINEQPTVEFTSRSANSCTLVLQYKTLEIFDNNSFNLDIGANHYINYTDSKIWNQRAITKPDGILFIKAQDEIIIGKNSKISSLYGSNGASWKKRYRAGVDEGYWYSTGGAPLGNGIDAEKGTTGLNESILDSRANSPIAINDGVFYGPGGMGTYGINHEDNTSWGRVGLRSDNLNNKIFSGIGACNYYRRDSYNTQNHYIGSSGGGIIIIQTPKITFKDKESCISTCSTTYGSSYNYGGYGGGGSILIKAENLEFKDNALLSTKQSTDYPTTNAIAGTLVDANGDAIPAVYDDYKIGNITTMAVWPNSQDDRDNKSVLYTCVGAPGQVQLEIDSITVEGTTIEKDNIDITNLQDFIKDFRTTNIVENIRELSDTDDSWDFSENNKLENHQFHSPRYEINTWFKFYTSGMKNINIEGWYNLIKFTSKFKNISGTSIKLAFSIDAGDSWNYINLDDIDNPVLSSIDIDTDFDTKGNTPEELNDFIDQTFLTKSFILPQRGKDNKFIDLCIALKTSKEHLSPLFDYIWLDYQKAPVIDAPIPINPFNGEEFNNEYVNFVWLQPSQKYGSIQNRIEVSTIPNFNSDENELIADEDDISSSNNQIILPYKPSDYDNTHNYCHSFKLPYIKKRNLPIENSYDNERHSVIFNKTDGTITYGGGDEYFVMGNNIKTVAQDDLSIPTALDFKLDTNNCPKHSSIVSYINFTGNEDCSGITDSIGTSLWKNVKVGNALNTSPNVAHTFAPKFYGSLDSYVQFDLDTSLTPTQGFIRSTEEKTIYIRFNPKNLTKGNDEFLFEMYNMHWDAGHCGVAIKKQFNQYGKLEVIVSYYNGRSWYRLTKGTIHEDTENVFALVYDTDNTVDIYLNGIKIINNVQAHYYDTENATYYTDTSDFRLMFGRRANHTSISYSYKGSIIDFAIFEDKLTPEEVQEISKIPVYSLRYDLGTNTMQWKQLPYFDHLSNYQFVQDKVDDFNDDAYRWEITHQHFAGTMNRCYYNNSESLLLGTFSPNEYIKDSFIEHKQLHKPINGIPFLLDRYSEINTARDKRLVYFDNNSLRLKNTNGTMILLDHKRINVNEDNIEMNFVYRDTEMDTQYQSIGVTSGAWTNNEYSTGSRYSRYAIIRKYKTGEFRVGVWVRHTNNRCYIQLNPDTDSVATNLPFDLIPDSIYSLKWMANDDIALSALYLYSNSDDNYKRGVKLWDQTMYNGHVPSSYGYQTRDFNDITDGHNNSYEDIGIVMQVNEHSSFEPINIATFNEESVKTQECGYIPRYDMTTFIPNDYLKKINYVDIKSNSLNALSDLVFFCSFNNGQDWKVYDTDSSEWVIKDTSDYTNGMTVNEIMALTTYNYEKQGGFSFGNSFKLKSVLITKDSRSTPYIEYVKISYNGPMIIDSWDDKGSFYNGTSFYYNDDGSWNPYIEPDFNSDSQNWKTTGSGVPDALNFVAGNGSKPSNSINKVFAGVRLLLNPKGKYYWRIAAFNNS